MVMAMEDAADEETAKRLRKVDFLNVLGQLAPMAGLFGTVYGMILAFQSIVAAGGNADPVLLAGVLAPLWSPLFGDWWSRSQP